jgi:hypothetical protein
MVRRILNTHEYVDIEKLKDDEQYVVVFESTGKFLKEFVNVLDFSGAGTLAVAIAKCFSFCRMCKEIEDKGGELRFKLNGKKYKMKFPK